MTPLWLKSTTQLLLIITIVVLTIYNVAVAWMYGTEATISGVLVDAGRRYPILIFVIGLALGVAIGHWWPVQMPPQ